MDLSGSLCAADACWSDAFVLSLSHSISIEGRGLNLGDFVEKKKQTKQQQTLVFGLCLDIYRLISFRLVKLVL